MQHGTVFSVPTRANKCKSNINRFVLLSIINMKYWVSQVYLALFSWVLYLVTVTSTITKKCLAMTTQQGILLTGHGTLEIKVFALWDWIKLPMYCEASGWIAHEVSEASFLLLIWGETEVTVSDLYTYGVGGKLLQLSHSRGEQVQNSYPRLLQTLVLLFHYIRAEQPLTQKWKNISIWQTSTEFRWMDWSKWMNEIRDTDLFSVCSR